MSLFSFPLPARARGDVRRQSASTMNERRCGRRRRRRRRRRVYARVFSLSFCVVIFAPICFIFSARQTSACKVVGGVLKLRDADTHTHTRAKRDNFKPAAPRRQHTHRYISQKKVTNMPKVKLGICAMNKKSRSANMQAILQRLDAFNEFEIIVFPDEVILNDPIESWPVVDALISFFSRGFPLEKAHEYVKLRKPFMVNDVTRQWTLLDRRLVYRTLMENNISGE